MNKLIYIFKILKDRWLKPYDDILIRFNTKAEDNNNLKWRIFINGIEYLGSGLEIHGYVYDCISEEFGVIKYNIACKGRVRWEKNKAIIFAVKKNNDQLV